MAIPRLPGHYSCLLLADATVIACWPHVRATTLEHALPPGLAEHPTLRDAWRRATEGHALIRVGRLEAPNNGDHAVWKLDIGPTDDGSFILELVDITTSIDSAMRSQQQGSLHLLGQFAHQIRNPLAGITGAIQVMSIELPEDHANREVMDMVLEESFRLNRLISDLVTLARDPDVRIEPHPVRDVVESVRRELRGVFPECDVAIEGAATWMTDAGHLRRMLFELMKNAAEAAGKFGQVIIQIHDDRLEISDSGEGVDPASYDEIFEPLFSTRGRGIGLGLAVVRRLGELIGHRVSVHRASELSGARFVIEVASPRAR
jgi:signal transduction histidine kinase